MKEEVQEEGQVGAVGVVEVAGVQLDMLARLTVMRQTRLTAFIFFSPVEGEKEENAMGRREEEGRLGHFMGRIARI